MYRDSPFVYFEEPEIGGSYHIQCAYLGLLSRYENKGAFDEFLKFLKFQAKDVLIFTFINYSYNGC